jgi:hypothetical protein
MIRRGVDVVNGTFNETAVDRGDVGVLFCSAARLVGSIRHF